MNEPIDILLVEDDPQDVELTMRAFREHNLANAIRVARDGEEALEMLFGDGNADSTDRPRLVLLDLKLPKVDGLEVLRKIRSVPRFCSMPVVVLTSSREEPDLQMAYELGANSCLCKPVEFQEFVSTVRQVGMYWLLMNVCPDC